VRDLAYDLANNAAKVKYEHLPKDVVEITKKFILDTLATMVAGSSAPGCKSVIDLMKDKGGKQESTILIYEGKAVAENAAFANSMMAHALDFDDTHDEAVLHANVSVLPAALAMAERKGGVSGKDLITAIAVGVDLMSRLGLGAKGPLNWILSSTAAYFGSTVAAGRLLGLDEDRLLHAMGIAYSQCAGSYQCLVDGGLVKRMQPAFAARAAIMSSILAQRGITGARNIFEGQFGFFPIYYDGKYDRKKVIKELGTEFEGKNLSIKLYPCCRYVHGCVDATLSLVQQNDIRPDDVAEVVAHVTQATYDFVGKPFEIRVSPQVDAQFSLPYTISVAIVRRDVFIDDFFEEKIKEDTQVLQFTKKVRVIVDQEPIAKGLTPCVVDIKTKDGKVYSERVEILRGDPRKPVGMEDIAQKFRKCAAFSAKPISKENIEEIIRIVSNLETVSDVGEVVRLVT
jgi:2-methylcitrate dehydratase PrpD